MCDTMHVFTFKGLLLHEVPGCSITASDFCLLYSEGASICMILHADDKGRGGYGSAPTPEETRAMKIYSFKT